MSRPSIVVINCGKAFSFASAFRQSYPVPQLPAEVQDRVWSCWAPGEEGWPKSAERPGEVLYDFAG